MSTKYTTVSVRVTENVREALDMELAKLGCKSYKVLLERIIMGYGNTQVEYFKKHEIQADTDLKNISDDIAKVQEELANETDTERSKWLASKLETYRTMQKQFLESRETNHAAFNYYVKFLSTAFPCHSIDETDVDPIFKELN